MLALALAVLLPFLPAADQAPASSGAPPARVAAPLLPARSFSQVFAVPDTWFGGQRDILPPKGGGKETMVVPVPQPGMRKKVVCGMTVIIVDGKADPKMAVAPQGGRDVDPGMPRVPKPMCGEK